MCKFYTLDAMKKRLYYAYLESSVGLSLTANFLNSLSHFIVGVKVLGRANLLLHQTEDFVSKLLEFIYLKDEGKGFSQLPVILPTRFILNKNITYQNRFPWYLHLQQFDRVVRQWILRME